MESMNELSEQHAEEHMQHLMDELMDEKMRKQMEEQIDELRNERMKQLMFEQMDNMTPYYPFPTATIHFLGENKWWINLWDAWHCTVEPTTDGCFAVIDHSIQQMIATCTDELTLRNWLQQHM